MVVNFSHSDNRYSTDVALCCVVMPASAPYLRRRVRVGCAGVWATANHRPHPSRMLSPKPPAIGIRHAHDLLVLVSMAEGNDRVRPV